MICPMGKNQDVKDISVDALKSLTKERINFPPDRLLSLFKQVGGVNKITNTFVLCFKDFSIGPFPTFATVFQKQYFFTNFHHRIHVVRINDSGYLIFLGNFLNQVVDQSRGFGI